MKNKLYWIALLGGLILFSAFADKLPFMRGLVPPTPTPAPGLTPVPVEPMPFGLPPAAFTVLGALLGFGLTILAALAVRALINRLKH